MCQNRFFPCLQGIRMRKDLTENNRKQMYDQIKKYSIKSSEKIQMQEYTKFRKKRKQDTQ